MVSFRVNFWGVIFLFYSSFQILGRFHALAFAGYDMTIANLALRISPSILSYPTCVDEIT